MDYEISYKNEFEKFDGEFYLPEGFTDYSSHHDAMPCCGKTFEKNGREACIIIWQNYENVDLRQEGTADFKYIFQILVDEEPIFAYVSNELDTIKSLVDGVNMDFSFGI